MTHTTPPAATALRKYLSSRNVAQARFAMLELGVSESCIKNWLRGRSRPSLENAIRIQAVTGIDAALWTGPSNEAGIDRG